MKSTKIALMIAAASMAFSVTSVSAGELANEFGGFLAAGDSKVKGGASNTFGFGQVFYGRFFSPSFEGTVGMTYAAAAGTNTTGIDIGGNYYFTPVGKKGNAAFYVGADVGTTSGSGASSDQWSLNGGMKYFVTDSASVNVALKHQEQKQAGTTTELNLITVGASAYF